MNDLLKFVKDLLKSEKEKEKELERELEKEFPTNWDNILGLGKPDLTH